MSRLHDHAGGVGLLLFVLLCLSIGWCAAHGGGVSIHGGAK